MVVHRSCDPEEGRGCHSNRQPNTVLWRSLPSCSGFGSLNASKLKESYRQAAVRDAAESEPLKWPKQAIGEGATSDAVAVETAARGDARTLE